MQAAFGKLSAIPKTLNGWLIPAFVFLLASFPYDKVLAEDPAPIIDLSPLAKYMKRDNRQPEQDQSTAHSGTTPSSTDPVGVHGMNGLDSSSTSQKWDKPAKIEEIPSVDEKKHFLIATPLPVPVCVINEINSSFKQQRLACENTKF